MKMVGGFMAHDSALIILSRQLRAYILQEFIPIALNSGS